VGIGLAQITGALLAPDANRQMTARAAERAFVEGADIVVLPELVISGYTADPTGLADVAEPIDGPTVALWTALADEHDGLVAGGFCEREGDALYNTAVLVDRTGVLGHYRKLHLFDAEKEIFTPGNRGLPVVTTRFGLVGLCVCYDLRFVEVLRLLALQGAALVCVPTAWVVGFDQTRWDSEGFCPQAHGVIQQANLDQVFVACASQVGIRNGLEFLGSSVVVDPFGRVLVGPLSGTEEAVTTVVVDLEEVEHAQARAPRITPRADRRTDVYSIDLGGRQL
jgi:predicted amidohydrolase